MKDPSKAPLYVLFYYFFLYFINAINKYFKPKLPKYIAILSKLNLEFLNQIHNNPN